MKTSKRLLLIALMTVLALVAYAQEYDPEFDFVVARADNGGVKITNYLGRKKEVNIPPRIQNMTVTEIGGKNHELF